MSQQPTNFDLSKQLKKDGMTPSEANSFLFCCHDYKSILTLIDQYDKKQVAPSSDSTDWIEWEYKLEVDKANLIIVNLKSYLARQGEHVDNFGVARNGGVEKVVESIYQTWDEQELYPTTASKAAHLFYFLIKDHLFVDGNKRIATFLFIWFMEMNAMFATSSNTAIASNTFYTLAIFVAESNPKDKQLIVEFIQNLITSHQIALPG